MYCVYSVNILNVVLILNLE